MYISRIAETNIKHLMSSKKILIILGARQVGKTTLIERVITDRTSVSLNFDISVDKDRFVAAAHFSPKDAMKTFGNPSIFVVDEAQRLPEGARIVKGWYDAGIDTKIVLLGSSSLNLLDQTVEALTGRNEKIVLPPLLFSEIIHTQPWFSPQFKAKSLHQSFQKQIDILLLQLIIFGSYPETITTGEKEKYLLNLTSDYLLKDIYQTSLLKSPETLQKLLSLLAYQVGSEVSTNELATNLQISRQTVERYLELLERTFVIFRLPAYSTNQRKEIIKNKKIYFWDTGVRNTLLKEFSVSPYRGDIGALWENWVVAEFAKLNALSGDLVNLYFWKTRDGSEVDLVVKGSRIFKAFEIKWSKSRSSSARSFKNRYGKPVQIINRSNIVEVLSLFSHRLKLS